MSKVKRPAKSTKRGEAITRNFQRTQLLAKRLDLFEGEMRRRLNALEDNAGIPRGKTYMDMLEEGSDGLIEKP